MAKKTEINIGDLMSDLANYLGIDQYKLETELQRLVTNRLTGGSASD